MSDRTARTSRGLLALAIATLVAVSIAATWIASDRIRSPAEAAARTVAPEAAPILVPVEARVISTDVVTRGTGRFGSPQTLSTPPSSIKATGLVDRVPDLGATIAEGDVVMISSGRPVILLQGAQPAFRDLGPGMMGSDVLQLEQALGRLGFPPGDVDGTYDLATQFAVTEWYRSLGFTPITMTDEQRATIRAIEGELQAIERETTAGAEGLAATTADLSTAQDGYRLATRNAADLDGLIQQAGDEADAANAIAASEVTLALAAQDQARANLPPVWATLEEQRSALAELHNLGLALEAAQAAAEATRLAGQAAVLEAERRVAAAPADIAAAAAAVQAAQVRVDIASQAKELAAAPASALEQDLELAKERAGVQVPVDEVIFVSSAPVRVAETHVARGDSASGPLLSVTDDVIAIDGTLALDEALLVQPGMQVEITEPDLGIVAMGTVSAVADRPGTRGADGFHLWFETLTDGSSLTNVVGASVRLTIPIESTGGAALAVPASALSLSADGSSRILIDRDGTLETVIVDPGLSADGYVAIEVIDGRAGPGDLVFVGVEAPGGSTGGGGGS